MRTGKGRRWAALLLCLTMVLSTVGAADPSATDPAAPTDAPAPVGDTGMEGPGLDEPSADGGIMPTANGENMDFVSVQIDGVAFADGDSGGATVTGWEYDKVKQLDVRFNTNSDPGQVRITVPAGLDIISYTPAGGGLSTVGHVQHSSDLPDGYTSTATASVTYSVDTATTEGYIYVSIGVDRVLWPKTESWTTGAIKVELLTADGTPHKTQSARAQIVRNASESATYNVIQSDANASVPPDANKEFRLKNYQVVGNLTGSPMGGYFKTVTVTMPIPYDTNGGTHYATYANRVVTNVGAPTVTENSDAHTLTITWNNVHVPTGSSLVFIPYFKWDTARTKSGDGKNQVQLAAGPTANLVFFDGTTLNDVKQNDPLTSFNLTQDVQLASSATTKEVYSWYGSDTNKVYQLGQFWVENEGFEKSGALTLTFTYNSAHAGVTAQRIPGRVTAVQYTANDGLGQQDGMSLMNGNTIFAPDGKYFTQIVATVDGLEPGAGMYYNHSAPLSPGNQGVTFGKLLTGDTFTDPGFATLTITGADSVPAPASFTLTVQNAPEREQAIPLTVSPGSGVPLLSKTEVEAGSADSTAHFSGVIATTSYPYGNNVTAMHPAIYVRLPNGVTMQSLSIRSGETAVTPATEDDHSEWGGDGYHVYKITFTDSQGQVGWFKEDLSETRLTLEFDIVAGLDAKSTTLAMRDCVLVAYNEGGAPGLTASNYGSLDANLVLDTNDVDGDGNSTEKLCTVQQAQSVSLTIKPARRGLHFEARAKLRSEAGYYNYSVSDLNSHLSCDEKIMYLTKEDDTIDFQLTAENNAGAALDVKTLLAAESPGTDFFCYYVPIPKIGENIHGHFQPDAFELTMVLDAAKPCVVSYENWADHNDAFVVDYGKVTAADYNENAPYHSGYVRGSGSGDDGDNMVRIKLNSAVETIPANAKVTVTLHYAFHLDPTELVGQYVEFGVCGQSLFTTDGTPSKGHSPTQRVRAELQTGRIAGRGCSSTRTIPAVIRRARIISSNSLPNRTTRASQTKLFWTATITIRRTRARTRSPWTCTPRM